MLVSGIGRYFDLIYGTRNALLASVDGYFWWADIFALLAWVGSISMEALVWWEVIWFISYICVISVGSISPHGVGREYTRWHLAHPWWEYKVRVHEFRLLVGTSSHPNPSPFLYSNKNGVEIISTLHFTLLHFIRVLSIAELSRISSSILRRILRTVTKAGGEIITGTSREVVQFRLLVCFVLFHLICSTLCLSVSLCLSV